MDVVGVRDCWVYKAYDAEFRLLYVGISVDGKARISEHVRSSAWTPYAMMILVEHFSTREAALKRERELIVELKPEFNIAGKPVAPHELVAVDADELSLPEAAQCVKFSVNVLRNEIALGRLIAQGTERGYRIRRTDLWAWATTDYWAKESSA